MRRAIILHGKPSEKSYFTTEGDSESNSHWLPWLQQQLCARNILAQTPEMPRPYAPEYPAWRDEFERQVVDEDTILIGHSCGGGFLVRWLSENPSQKIAKLVLVAPWLDIEKQHGDLFDFAIDRHLADRTINGIDLLYSTNDGKEVQATLARIRQSIDGVRYHEFVDYGHFCLQDMKTRAFPELLSIVKQAKVE